MYATFYNPTDGPVVIDAAGRSIGGRDYGTAETTADEVQAAVESGRLLQSGDLDSSNDNADRAREAHQRTAEVAGRADKLGKLGKDRLAQLATDEDVPVSDEAHKDELVHELALRGVDPPSRSSSSKTSSSDDDEE